MGESLSSVSLKLNKAVPQNIQIGFWSVSPAGFCTKRSHDSILAPLFRKKYDRAEAEYSQACADVARRHYMPQFVTSICFIVLLRILGAEYSGKVVGVMPFVPTNLLTKLTTRGLGDWKSIPLDDLKKAGTSMQPQQAFSFLFVYMLASMSVKYYVNKAVAIQPPPGADGGMQTIAESPMGKAIAKNLGIDPDSFKEQ